MLTTPAITGIRTSHWRHQWEGVAFVRQLQLCGKRGTMISAAMGESDGSMPPDRYSMNARTGTGKPWSDCHPSTLAEFGSDPNVGGQARKPIRQLCLIQEDDLLPEIVKPAAEFCETSAAVFPSARFEEGLPC